LQQRHDWWGYAMQTGAAEPATATPVSRKMDARILLNNVSAKPILTSPTLTPWCRLDGGG
jgi:hypothetical protein